MPKSAHLTNQHAKIAAAAIIARMAGMPPPEPMVISHADYSFFDPRSAAHTAAVLAYDNSLGTYRTLPGASDVSAARSEAEGKYAWAWARGLWADAPGRQGGLDSRRLLACCTQTPPRRGLFLGDKMNTLALSDRNEVWIHGLATTRFPQACRRRRNGRTSRLRD